MKRIWHHPEQPTTGKRYWRSLGEYADTPEFQEKLGREFDPAIAETTGEETESSRRHFMKLMGGAAALSGLTLASCRRPIQKVMPFTKHVEWIVPGKPLLYATVVPGARDVSPAVVVTNEGRPTHLQGNPLHPSGAGLNIFAQSSILDLYNPDRALRPALKGKEVPWSEYQEYLNEVLPKWKESAGEGLALLLNPSTSVTRAGLIADFLKAYPKAKAFEYEPIHQDGKDAAQKALLGDGVKLLPSLLKADRVLSLDCDFIGLDAPYEAAAKEFMSRRAPANGSDQGENKMNRSYVIENRYTLTGGISDHRLPLPAALIPSAAAVLAEEVGKLTGNAGLGDSAKALTGSAEPKLREWLAAVAKDLVDNKGKSLVLAGPRYSAGVHAIVLGINQALGALGSTLMALTVDKKVTGTWADLTADLKGKKLKHIVVMTETDPAYDAKAEFHDVIKGMEEAPEVTHLTMRPNHTTRLSRWALPMAHYLESWDDARSAAGVYSVVQPMIQPLFDGISVNELLLAFLGRKKWATPVATTVAAAAPVAAAPAAATGAPAAPAAAPAAPAAVAAAAPVAETDPAWEAVKATFTKIAGGWSEEKWDLTLRDGFLAGSSYPAASASVNAGAAGGLIAKEPKITTPSGKMLEVVLTPDASVLDGRYIDNPWLQEAPDPITKLTWDNAAWINPTTFAELGLKHDGDLVHVDLGGDRSLKIAALAMPGQARYSITIPLGYGQESFNVIGNKRGFNGYTLRGDTGAFVFAEASVKKDGENYDLAITQETYVMDGRAQVREGTQEHFKEDITFAKTTGMDSHIPPNMTLYQGRVGSNDKDRKDYNPDGDPKTGNVFDYKELHQWGMVIDLGKCIGCSACIVACQSENNIPIVGKDQVQRGRVMHWIRMDRYFATSGGVEDHGHADLKELDNPEMVSQPLACQHCEAAPCETVCPVNATVHTEEGLNAMAYNRCIGTRYCANNCPYTARRFNWFNYNKRNPLIETKVAGLIEVRNLYAGPLGVENQTTISRLQKNPNVTVRMRGVIEKCTYCVQRLESAKINQRRVAKDDHTKLRIPTDSVQTACQASCPTEAIMFGDMANHDSTVNKWKDSPRAYDVLKYIGTRPRTSYLARIKNVNPHMPEDPTRIVPTGEVNKNQV